MTIRTHQQQQIALDLKLYLELINERPTDAARTTIPE